MLRTLVRTSLWVLLIPSFCMSLVIASMSFGSDDWRWDRPLYVVFVFAAFALPALICFGLTRSGSDSTTKVAASAAVASWAFALFYVAVALGWLPTNFDHSVLR